MRAALLTILSACVLLPQLGCGKRNPSAPKGSGPARVAASAPGDGADDGAGAKGPSPAATKGKPWNGLSQMGPRTLNDPNDQTVVIKGIAPNSPAEKSGLRVGDLILKKNGEPLTKWEEFRDWIRGLAIGTRYTLTIEREGKEMEVSVTVGVLPGSEEGGSNRSPAEALAAGMEWIATQQLDNGAWPHSHESIIKQKGEPNPAVTGLEVLALSMTAESRAKYAARIANGIDYMLRSETPKGYLAEAGDAMRYGNFATAEAILAMTRVDRGKYKEPIAKLVAYLGRAQIDETHGFQSYDWPFGGWDYYDDLRPRPMRADIVLASLVVDALHAVEVPSTAPVMQKALAYVRKCQNWKDSANDLTQYDDGGFFFTPRESKAGEKEVGGGGNLRFTSYGTVTCDGLRSLLELGEAKDSPRVKAAVAWLAENYNLEVVPGFPPKAAVDFEHGLRYYYYMALATALDTYGEAALTNRAGTEVRWAPGLAKYLAGLQRADGSWSNGITVMNEDDPLFATGMAVQALATALGRSR